METRLINVGIADLKVGRENDLLRTILGSCVGICLHDKVNFVGGLSHILLPESGDGSASLPKKYANTAIPMLIETMVEYGANRKNLTAKLVGGAQVLFFAKASIISEIGVNNIKKVKEILSDLNINVIAEDLGGDFGRTIEFSVNSGIVRIKSMRRPEKVI